MLAPPLRSFHAPKGGRAPSLRTPALKVDGFVVLCNHQCSSRIKGCPQANYTWSQISRMRRSLEQIKQFEVNSRTKSINSLSAKR